MSDVLVAGVGMTPFARHRDLSLEALAGQAFEAVLGDAGCSGADIGIAYYSGVPNGALQGQTAIPGQVVLHNVGIVGIPVFNIENACASGTSD